MLEGAWDWVLERSDDTSDISILVLRSAIAISDTLRFFLLALLSPGAPSPATPRRLKSLVAMELWL